MTKSVQKEKKKNRKKDETVVDIIEEEEQELAMNKYQQNYYKEKKDWEFKIKIYSSFPPIYEHYNDRNNHSDVNNHHCSHEEPQ